ncbi:MAG TPA: hypothetical protein IGS17_00510 [Oscillatoriales cyanobacterium M59_W2019_021]|nr:hypothetical protein [Oscillatoriales cyanobacterium M4454_W2019_049]HIK49398.1 hypothetical protein [Oscillatoriales cyanobacterium M59_W2019_021]
MDEIEIDLKIRYRRRAAIALGLLIPFISLLGFGAKHLKEKGNLPIPPQVQI